jgi:hypothetical protein
VDLSRPSYGLDKWESKEEVIEWLGAFIVFDIYSFSKIVWAVDSR